MRPESLESRIARHRREYAHIERLLRRLGFDPEKIPAERAEKILEKELDT